MSITVNVPQDIDVKLLALAQARWDLKRKGGVKSKLVDRAGGNNDVLADHLGQRGQWAVSDLFGCPFDWTVMLGGDGGEKDLEVGERLVQVKSTYRPSRLLLFATREDFKPGTVAVLCIVDGDRRQPTGATVEVRGWCTRETFSARCKQETYRVDPCWVMDPQYLEDIRTLGPLYDPNRPPEYAGRTWPMATKQGVVQSPYPPLRNDPASLTDEFMDFRFYHSNQPTDPQYLCARCKIWQVITPGNWCVRCVAPAQYDRRRERGPYRNRGEGKR